MAENEEGMEVRQIPIEWHVSEHVHCQYATNLVVQPSDQEFLISFFHVLPPLLVGPAEEVKAKLDEVSAVRAECVARVIVAAGRMGEFVDVLQRSLEAYQNRPRVEGG
jgi:hypothetical protein